ncbi:uncharacterized protein RJT21DRAFT_133243 [Scheffersomyces amazonensis]|uniref:uncharacterized protein n=1 Tax=Scheffersomyces amazonensis TaxID=1078765 RepID=UPI00315C94B1
MRVSGSVSRLVVSVLIWASVVVAYQQFCKCECNSKFVIKPIDKCGSCTKDFCLEVDSTICSIEGNNDGSEEDVRSEVEKNIIISCYQIESPKDALIIYLFAGLVVSLFVISVYQTYFNYMSVEDHFESAESFKQYANATLNNLPHRCIVEKVGELDPHSIGILLRMKEIKYTRKVIHQHFHMSLRLNFLTGNQSRTVDNDTYPHIEVRTIRNYNTVYEFLEANSDDIYVDQLVIYHNSDFTNLMNLLCKFNVFFLTRVTTLSVVIENGVCWGNINLNLLLSFHNLKSLTFNNIDFQDWEFTNLGHLTSIEDIHLNSVVFKHWQTFSFPKSVKNLFITANSIKDIKHLQIPEHLDHLSLTIPDLSDSFLKKILHGISDLKTLTIHDSRLKHLDGKELPIGLIDFTISDNKVRLKSIENYPYTLKHFKYHVHS